MTSIDSNIVSDSGLTMGFNGAYPATLSEGGLCFNTSTAMNLRQVKFNMVVASGSPLGTFNAQLFASSGTFGISCQPTGNSLVTSENLVIGSISGDTPFFTFNSYFELQAKTTYAVSIRLISCVKCDNNNYWQVKYVQTDSSITSNIYYWNNPYANGLQHSKLKYEIDGSSIIQLKTKFGSLTVRNVQQANNFTVYANGTILFNVVGLEVQQRNYQFNAVSYGNGTFTIKFIGGPPFRVTTAGISTYNGVSEIISYTTMTTSILIVDYIFIPCIPIVALLPLSLAFIGLVGFASLLFAKRKEIENDRFVIGMETIVVGASILILVAGLIPSMANLIAGTSVC